MTKTDIRQRTKSKRKLEVLEADNEDDSNWPYAKGKMDNYAFAIGITVLVVTTSLIGFYRYQQYLKDIIITPLDSPLIIPKNGSSAALSPERFWGTYRPQAYFGIKARCENSPVFGLMWMQQLTNQMPPPLRHWCDQGDQLDGYSWLKHDGVSFGVQEIREKSFVVKTEFLKRPGGENGGDWSARITFTPRNPNSEVVVSGFFYVALDKNNGMLQPSLSKNSLKAVDGYFNDLGNFRLYFSETENKNMKNNYLVGYANQLDQLKDVVQNGLKVEAWDKARTKGYFTLSGRRVPRDVPGPNFVVKEITATLPFTMEISFESDSFTQRNKRLVANNFESALMTKIKEFDSRFETVFALKDKGFSDKEVDFAKAILSNMIGGIGYFYGQSLVQSQHNKEPISYWNAPLYTAVPSRPFFPRGFLWDEGFHNILIAMWDSNISKDIIGHWFDLINIEGWIPREQILGEEARAKVPSEFVVQRNTNANPPTFLLPLQAMIKEMIDRNSETDKRYLSALYPRLKTWFEYYNTTQSGNSYSSYYWHGRDPSLTKQLNPLTLASGLDDYPRASHPSDNERHVDLRCWLCLAAGVMADIAQSLGEKWQDYEALHKLLSDNKLLDKLHWSSTGKQYSDFGLHTDKAKLVKPKPEHLKPGQPIPQLDKIRVIEEQPSMKYVDAFGYVSLFPFLIKIIDADSPKLNIILNDLTNPKKLWTDFGLRSLSRSSRFYGRYNTEHDPPYWRGPIWINMNYLCLSALHHYSVIPGPYQARAKDIYSDLRRNIVNNMIKEFHRTGYIWENYNDKTGEGKGSHPFTGWSALVVLIMAEKF